MHSKSRHSLGARVTSAVMINVFGLSTPLTALASVAPRRAESALSTRTPAPASLAHLRTGTGAAARRSPSSFDDVSPAASPVPIDGTATTSEVSVPVAPVSARWERGSGDVWDLLDGDANTAWKLQPGEAGKLFVEFAEPIALTDLTLLGPTRGQLSAYAETDWGLKALPGLTDIQVSAREGQ